jgi:hypothetical protein
MASGLQLSGSVAEFFLRSGALKFYILTLILVFSIGSMNIGCGKGATGSTSSGATGRTGQETDPNDKTNAFVNGKKASDYYKQFIYKANEDANEFKYLSSSAKGKKLKDQDLTAQVDLFLFEDGNYTMDYREHTVENENGETFEEHSQRLTGTWHVAGSKLKLKDLATGDGLAITRNGVKTQNVVLRFSRDLHTKGLTGLMITLNYVTSSKGLE